MRLAVVVVVSHVVQRLEGHLNGQVVAVGARVIERGSDGGVADVGLAVLYRFENSIVSTQITSQYDEDSLTLVADLTRTLNCSRTR